MGAASSREELEISDSESDSEENYEDVEEELEQQNQSYSGTKKPISSTSPPLDEIDEKLKALKLKYSSSSNKKAYSKNSVKLYLHIGGNTPNSKWITSEKLTTYSFVKSYDDDDDEEGIWVLKIGSKIKAKVGTELQFKPFGDQCRVDFVSDGVWAVKFFENESCRSFLSEFHVCLFENVYGFEATEENKVKVYGKDFIGWAKPEVADDTAWENAEDSLPSNRYVSDRSNQDLMEEFEEEVNAGGGGIQSLALGALDNSFLVNNSGIQVVKNYSHGIHGKGVYVKSFL